MPTELGGRVDIDARRLRRRSEAADLTQVQLAVLAGVSPGTVSRLERSTQLTHLATVEALAGVLGCDPLSLVAPEDRARITAVHVPADPAA